MFVVRRKVLALGKVSRGVVLPTIWLRAHGIEPGDEVEMSFDEKTLTLSPPEKEAI